MKIMRIGKKSIKIFHVQVYEIFVKGIMLYKFPEKNITSNKLLELTIITSRRPLVLNFFQNAALLCCALAFKSGAECCNCCTCALQPFLPSLCWCSGFQTPLLAEFYSSLSKASAPLQFLVPGKGGKLPSFQMRLHMGYTWPFRLQKKSMPCDYFNHNWLTLSIHES